MRMKGSTDYWDKQDSGATAPAGVKCFMVNVKMKDIYALRVLLCILRGGFGGLQCISMQSYMQKCFMGVTK